MGRILVSLCRCLVLVSEVHPVAMRRAECWIVDSLVSEVSDMRVDQVGLAYSSMGLVMALYVEDMVSFDFPHLVVVRDLRMLMVVLAFSAILEQWV